MKGSIMANKWDGAYDAVQGAITYTSAGVVRYKNKGVRRARKALKRAQAEARNALTSPERRRSAARKAGFPRHSDKVRAGK